MFKLIGNLKYTHSNRKIITIPKKDIKEGINFHKDYIIKLKKMKSQCMIGIVII